MTFEKHWIIFTVVSESNTTVKMDIPHLMGGSEKMGNTASEGRRGESHPGWYPQVEWFTKKLLGGARAENQSSRIFPRFATKVHKKWESSPPEMILGLALLFLASSSQLNVSSLTTLGSWTWGGKCIFPRQSPIFLSHSNFSYGVCWPLCTKSPKQPPSLVGRPELS